MKKNNHIILDILLIVIMIIAMFFLSIQNAFAFESKAFDITRKTQLGKDLKSQYVPRGSIVSEVNTGRVLFHENSDLQWTPASMSKLMVIELAYEEIEKGVLSMDSETVVPEKYMSLVRNPKLSNNDARVGCRYTVSELISLIIVPSSAIATYMLADMIEPDYVKFVQLMNKRAGELGMSETVYVNPIGVRSGLLKEFAPEGSDPEADNLTSARDYAILATHIIREHRDILNHTGERTIVIKEGTAYEETFTGYNHALPGAAYPLKGMDGLKTGSADKGYNFTGTAQRGSTRLVEVLLGVSKWDDKKAEYKRHIVGNALLQDCFSKYEYRCVLRRGRHKIDGVMVNVEEDLWDLVPKDHRESQCRLNQDNKTITSGFKTDFLPGYREAQVGYYVGSYEFLYNHRIAETVILVVLILLLIIRVKVKRR